ncbi:MAG: DUF6675 family protein [Rectinemataceae bacterium]|jgi:hypothetical protein
MLRSAAALLTAALLFLNSSSSSAVDDSGVAGPVFRFLSAEEASRLESGALLIRNVTDPSLLALAADGLAADALRSKIASLKPNYLTEVLASVPTVDEKTASAILERLAATFADPKGYVGIPYRSKRNRKTYDLFDKMEVRTRAALPGGESIEVLQHMEPFDDFRARYEYSIEGSALRFTGSNLDPIIYSYRKFKAVSPGGMVWAIYAFRDGGRVIFYGVGAVKAFDLFGTLRDRLEPSFMGRVEAFFTAMSSKMKE